MIQSKQSGQALLLLIMMIAVVATIGGAAAFRSRSQARIVAQAQDGHLVAQTTEGLVVQALKGATPSQELLANLDISVAPIETHQISETSFVPGIIPRDGQFTLYMADYTPATNTFGPGYAPSAPLKIFFSSRAEECPVLELTHIYLTPSNVHAIKKEISRACGTNEVLNTTTTGIPVVDENTTIGSYTFRKSITTTSIANTKILLIRPLFTSTRIGFNQTLKPQGVKVSASARTNTGSQQSLDAYKPHPQLPADFFTTKL